MKLWNFWWHRFDSLQRLPFSQRFSRLLLLLLVLEEKSIEEKCERQKIPNTKTWRVCRKSNGVFLLFLGEVCVYFLQFCQVFKSCHKNRHFTCFCLNFKSIFSLTFQHLLAFFLSYFGRRQAIIRILLNDFTLEKSVKPSAILFFFSLTLRPYLFEFEFQLLFVSHVLHLRLLLCDQFRGTISTERCKAFV